MNEQGVVVYTTGPACIRCTMTKRVLEQKGVPFTDYVNSTQDRVTV